jgi:hypothetical protein
MRRERNSPHLPTFSAVLSDATITADTDAPRKLQPRHVRLGQIRPSEPSLREGSSISGSGTL